jgi:hypothetical protein
MHRLTFILLPALVLTLAIVAVSLKGGAVAPQRASHQLLYDLVINGESFTVEGGRVTKLQSRKTPGTTYEVAIRLSPNQRVRLDKLQLDYDIHATVEETPDAAQRTIKLRHDLGFTILLAELGSPLDAAGQEKALAGLSDSAATALGGIAAGKVDMGPVRTPKFPAVKGLGKLLRYTDKQGFGHSCLVYVLTGDTFSASFFAQYLDRDAADVVPLIKRVLESIRPVQ